MSHYLGLWNEHDLKLWNEHEERRRRRMIDIDANEITWAERRLEESHKYLAAENLRLKASERSARKAADEVTHSFNRNQKTFRDEIARIKAEHGREVEVLREDVARIKAELKNYKADFAEEVDHPDGCICGEPDFCEYGAYSNCQNCDRTYEWRDGEWIQWRA